MHRNRPKRLTDKLVDTWLELAHAMTIRDVPAGAPRASLASGASGIAYTIAKLARSRGERGASAASKRWLQIAKRAAKRRDAFRAKGWPASTHSVMFGPIGLAATAALITPSPRTIGDYVTASRRRMARAPAEYMFGLAGNVFVAITLARESNRPEMTALVRDLGKQLAISNIAPGGFAHGDTGVLAARIVAARWCGEDPEPAIVAALAATHPADILAREGPLARSWCRGLAGYVLAWTLAAEHAGADACRAHAIAAGPHLLDDLDAGGGSLCCGLAGRAYALLAIARLDPAGPWLDHAIELAARATAHEIRSGGVLQGMPGIVALAHDLRAPHAARFPFVEVIG